MREVDDRFHGGADPFREVFNHVRLCEALIEEDDGSVVVAMTNAPGRKRGRKS